MTARTKILLFAKLSFSAALLYAALSSIDLAEVVGSLRDANLPLLAAAYLLVVVMQGLSALRWQLFAPSLLSYGRALRYTWIGSFYSHLLPGALAGDVAKGISLATVDHRLRVAALPLSIVTDRVLGLAVLVLLFDTTCAWLYFFDHDTYALIQPLALFVLVPSAGAAILFVAALAMSRNWRGAQDGAAGAAPGVCRINRVAQLTRYWAANRATLYKALALSAAIHVLNMVIFYISLRCLNIEAHFSVAPIVYPILSLVLMLPVTVSGIGLREATLIALFQPYGLTATAAVAVSWFSLLASVPVILVGGVLQAAEIWSGGARARI